MKTTLSNTLKIINFYNTDIIINPIHTIATKHSGELNKNEMSFLMKWIKNKYKITQFNKNPLESDSWMVDLIVVDPRILLQLLYNRFISIEFFNNILENYNLKKVRYIERLNFVLRFVTIHFNDDKREEIVKYINEIYADDNIEY